MYRGACPYGSRRRLEGEEGGCTTVPVPMVLPMVQKDVEVDRGTCPRGS
jgi:hypothetical protein